MLEFRCSCCLFCFQFLLIKNLSNRSKLRTLFILMEVSLYFLLYIPSILYLFDISHNWLVGVVPGLLPLQLYWYMIAVVRTVVLVVVTKHFVEFLPQVHEIKRIRNHSKVIPKVCILAFKVFSFQHVWMPSPYGIVIVFWKFCLLSDNWWHQF